MARYNNYRKSNAGVVVVSVLLVLLLLSSAFFFVAGYFGWFQDNELDKLYADDGTYTFPWADTPVVEASPLPREVVLVVVHGGEIFELDPTLQDTPLLVPDPSINPFSLDIMPMGNMTGGGTTTSPSSIPVASPMFDFYLNGMRSYNLSTTVQIVVENMTVEIPKSEIIEDDSQWYATDYYLYWQKDNGTWKRVKSDTTNYTLNFVTEGEGTYKICAVRHDYNEYDSTGFYARTQIYTVVFGEPEVGYIEVPTPPAKEGYTFVGWYFDEACTQLCTASIITEDTVLYAKYAINTYTVAFVSNGGTAIGDKVLDWGSTLTVTSFMPTLTGHDFKGWYTDPDFTNKVSDSLVVKANYTLYAKWEVKILKVTLMVNGEVFETLSVPWGSAIQSVKQQAQTPFLEVSRMVTDGIEFNGAADSAVLTSDSIMFLSEKSVNDVINTATWEFWAGLGLAVLFLGSIVGIIVAKVRQRG